MTRGRITPALAVLAAVIGIAGQAHAYVPPSEFIIKSMAAKKRGMNSIKVKSLVSEIQGDKPTGVRFRQTLTFDAQKNTVHRSAQDEQGRELFVFERELGSSSEVVLPVDLLLLSARQSAVMESLRKREIPIKSEAELLKYETEEERRSSEQVELSKLQPLTAGAGVLVAWVLAKDGLSGEGPRFWVEKDTFLPLRLSVRAEDAEVRFEGFRWVKEVPFPRVTELSMSRKIFAREEAQEIVVNGDAASATQSGGVSAGFTEFGNCADSGLRDFIRRYYRLVK